MGTVTGGASIHRRRVVRAASIAVIAVFAAGSLWASSAVAAVSTVPKQLIVGFGIGTTQAEQLAAEQAAHVTAVTAISPHEEVVTLDSGQSKAAAAAVLQQQPVVRYAVPNLIVRPPVWTPNDRGTVDYPGGWRVPQWNFMATNGVNAIGAWARVAGAHRPGGAGVTIALIDSGVAFTNWGSFRKAPDLSFTTFSYPWDFIYNDRWALDRNGHGTFLAGTLAQTTNNFAYMTGLAWGAKIMPLRILNAWGYGHSSALSEAIRYAADHGADVINLSLQFPPETKQADIPDVTSAIAYATAKESLIVAAAGNEPMPKAAFPAMIDGVLGVGATTEHRCLANYSNHGDGVDIVAPGGGGDANIRNDPKCRAFAQTGRDIVQIGLLTSPSGAALVPYRFSVTAEDGTSMAAPHASAAAALVIASGIIGADPTPAQIITRLTDSADPMGNPYFYGSGLLDAARAAGG